MNFVTLNDATFHYAVEGSGPKSPLLFINSLGSDFRIWDEMVADFAAEHQVIRYDKRGHGLSDAPANLSSAGSTIMSHANDLIALLDFLQLERVVLVGLSVGGMIALQTALLQPKRVKQLVLSDTAAKLGTEAYWNERIDAIRNRGMGEMAETILSRWFAPDFKRTNPASYQGARNLLTRADVTGYLATCVALRDADLRLPIAAVTTPTLILCGAEDNATPPAVVAELAMQLPNAQFKTIEAAGHTPCVEQPAAMSKLITQFLQEQTNVGE